MPNLRRATDRGHTQLSWLDSRHTFSFGHYFDPLQLGFGPLRVINEDRVAAGQGFGTHGHKDMEILSIVLSGAMTHKDSTGAEATIRPGDVQRMSAGTGVRHSEFNASKSEPLHFLQIWIEPEREGIVPAHEQRHFPLADRRKRLRLIASPAGDEGSVTIRQDVLLYSSRLDAGHSVSHVVCADRCAWVQMIHGEAAVNGHSMQAGDGLAVQDPQTLSIAASSDSELLLFDMAETH